MTKPICIIDGMPCPLHGIIGGVVKTAQPCNRSCALPVAHPCESCHHEEHHGRCTVMIASWVNGVRTGDVQCDCSTAYLDPSPKDFPYSIFRGGELHAYTDLDSRQCLHPGHPEACKFPELEVK